MRKYKKPLKKCSECKRLNFVYNGSSKDYYCSIHGDFISPCQVKKDKVSNANMADKRQNVKT